MTSHIKDIVSIVRYGYYSNTISNYILSKTKEKSVEYYLLLLKNIWKKDKDMAIFYANKIIATTTILRELARFELISLYVKNNQFDMAKKECEYLRNNFKNISEYARNLMIPGLKLLNAKYNILDKDFKVYSDNYEKNSVDKAILKLIFEGNKDKIIKFFSANYEKMYFFNLMLSDFSEKNLINNLYNNNLPHSTEGMSPAEGCLFYLARKKLITELLKNVKNFKEFILHYFELSDVEIKIFDMFLRNCVRYDIKWPITPYPKGKVRDFALKYGLGYKRVALGYYSFEDDERVSIDNIIDRFL